MIYLDNAATTKIDKSVASEIEKYNEVYFGNPSSLNKMGYIAEEKLKNINKYLLDVLGDKEGKIIWTSGGTESNNMALKSIAKAKKRSGMHIISDKSEHPSILRVLDELAKDGYEIEYVNIDNNGHIDIDDLNNKLRDDTILVTIMHVNNEIGSINDIAKIGKIIKNKNKNIVFHVDAIQSFGKIDINVKNMNIDMLSTSGHKIHGPKGVGFLYINNNINIEPMILGGGQQDGYRSGTINLPGIAGMIKAIEIIEKDKNIIYDNIYKLADRFITGIKNDKYIVIGDRVDFSPYIVAVAFKDVRAEVMLHALEEYDIYVGAGSACSSHNKKESLTLKSMNFQKDMMDKVVRFSFSRYNTIEDIDKTIEIIDKKYEELSKYIRK